MSTILNRTQLLNSGLTPSALYLQFLGWCDDPVLATDGLFVEVDCPLQIFLLLTDRS